MSQDTDITGARRSLIDDLTLYQHRFPDEAATAFQMAKFIDENSDCFERSNVDGHMTASAWIMHPHHEMVLLTHHRKLDKWLQLGGHADGCTNLLHVALQEASEESGIRHFDLLMTDIFDIDIHAIPARNNEPEHFHYDVRFLLRAHGEHYRVSEESHDLAWVSLESMRAYTNELSMLRMGDKCQRILRVSR